MRLFRYFTIFLVLFFLTILDVSFLANFSWHGVTLISSFVLVALAGLVGDDHIFIAISLGLVLLFATLSSAPILAIFLCFFILPSLCRMIVRRYMPEQNYLVALVYFLLLSALFDLVFIAFYGAWNGEIALSLLVFTLLHSLVAFVSFCIYKLRGKKQEITLQS